MSNYRKKERTSGFGYIDFRGDREANRRIKKIELPEVGAIIVFNEINKFIGPGNMMNKPDRGIGRIKKYYNKIVEVELFIRPVPNYLTCRTFQIIELEFGLIAFRELSEITYSDFYTYADLGLKTLSPELKKLMKKSEQDKP